MMTRSTEAYEITETTVYRSRCTICDEETTDHAAATPEHAARAFSRHWDQEHNPDGSYRDPCPKCGGRLKSAWSGVSCVNCSYTFCY